LRTFAYIDGFNLYYRALSRKPQYKWLDLRQFSTFFLAPENELHEIKYYTARVSGKRDPGQPERQNAYLRALKTIDGLSIFYGSFLPKQITRPLVTPISGLPLYVEVLTTEEKGSDVNLASHLIWDAMKDVFDVAVVVSKDTDLVEPIRIVAKEIGKPVGVICPDGACPKGLREVATFVRHVDHGSLSACQLPRVVRSRIGREIHRPKEWLPPSTGN